MLALLLKIPVTLNELPPPPALNPPPSTKRVPALLNPAFVVTDALFAKLNVPLLLVRPLSALLLVLSIPAAAM